MKNVKNKATGLMALATAMCLTVGTLAIFTDRFQTQATATAGTLDISVSQNWVNDADNAAAIANFKPGTALKLYYEVTNKGNLPADVKEIFVITTDKALGTTDATRQFDLYKAADITVEDGVVTEITGDPLEVKKTGSFTDTDSSTKYTLKYELQEDPIELTAASTNDDLDKHKATYYLVLNENVDNSFQEAKVQIDYLAQALQGDNTGDDTWENSMVVSESVNLGGSDSTVGEAINVVPKLNDT